MTPTAFIINPVALNAPANLGERIRALYPQARLCYTEGPGDAGRIASDILETAQRGGCMIVACGGDGTFREVADRVGDELLLGVVPTGTVNLVARELGIPQDPDAALRLLRGAREAKIYGAVCTDAESGRETLFFIGVSVGPDADSVHRVSSLAKTLLGKYSYFLMFLARLLRPIPSDIRWTVAGQTRQCGQLIALRTPHYGGPYQLSQQADLSRPGLDLVTVPGGRGPVVRLFWNAFRGRPTETGRYLLETVNVVLPNGRYQLDGDAFSGKVLRLAPSFTPVRVAVPA